MKRSGDMNQYERAIYEVGSVLQKFAFEGSFVMYGFGGIPNYLEGPEGPIDGRQLIKCWNLAGEQPDSGFAQSKEDMRGIEKVVDGTMGALGIYHKAVMKTTFAGPTYFAGVLKRFLA